MIIIAPPSGSDPFRNPLEDNIFYSLYNNFKVRFLSSKDIDSLCIYNKFIYLDY